MCVLPKHTTVNNWRNCLSPVENLTATVNPDNTVTLNWTNPDPRTWPSDCQGNLNFDFILKIMLI